MPKSGKEHKLRQKINQATGSFDATFGQHIYYEEHRYSRDEQTALSHGCGGLQELLNVSVDWIEHPHDEVQVCVEARPLRNVA